MEPEGPTLKSVREMQFALFVLFFASSPNSYSISEFTHKNFENILGILVIISDKENKLQKWWTVFFQLRMCLILKTKSE